MKNLHCFHCQWLLQAIGSLGLATLYAHAGSALPASSAAPAEFYLKIPDAPKIPARIFKLRDYGGVGDGKTSNTEAFAKAIQACERAGGGRVLVTSGTYLTGPIQLVSRMALIVDKGAVIQASRKFSDFGLPEPLPATQAELNRLKPASLISGSKLTDVAICGEGTIDGAGVYWWRMSDIASQRGLHSVPPLPEEAALKNNASGTPEITPDAKSDSDSESEGKEEGESIAKPEASPGAQPQASGTAVPSQKRNKPAKPPYVPRAHMVMLRDCSRVLVQNVTLSNSPKFHLVPSRCQELLIEGVKIVSPSNAPNTDGIDPGNCRDVLVRNCFIDTGDDNIALKANGTPESGAMERITVSHCKFGHGHGVSIGSETSAGVRNFLVENCSFENTDNGLRIKSGRSRGGTVENVLYRDIAMKNVGDPLTIFLYYEDKGEAREPAARPVSPTTPQIRNVVYRNIRCEGATKKALDFVGLPESPLREILLEKVQVTGATTSVSLQDATGLQMKEVDFLTGNKP
jgi:polygalacturonase